MFTGLLNNEAVFLANTITADAYGGQSVTNGTVTGPIKCRIRQLSMAERDILFRQGIDSNYRLYCQAGVTILKTYTAKVDDVEYEVTAVDNPHFMNRHLQVDLSRKETGE